MKGGTVVKARAALAAGFLVAGLAGTAAAGPFEDAVSAYKGGDYATAMRLFHQLADQGDASAKFNIGLLYAHGRGVPQDFTEAARWYREAAEQGDADAQYSLGLLYVPGYQGVPQNYTEAARWCTARPPTRATPAPSSTSPPCTRPARA
jgi:TPR repeat protein